MSRTTLPGGSTLDVYTLLTGGGGAAKS